MTICDTSERGLIEWTYEVRGTWWMSISRRARTCEGLAMANHERLLSTHIEWHLSLCIVRSSKDECPAFAAELQPHQYV
jgi:hypothetical protein